MTQTITKPGFTLNPASLITAAHLARTHVQNRQAKRNIKARKGEWK